MFIVRISVKVDLTGIACKQLVILCGIVYQHSSDYLSDNFVCRQNSTPIRELFRDCILSSICELSVDVIRKIILEILSADYYSRSRDGATKRNYLRRNFSMIIIIIIIISKNKIAQFLYK